MPHAIKLSPKVWKYKCSCGCEMELHYDTDKKPDKLVKCFQCIKKEEEARIKAIRNKKASYASTGRKKIQESDL